MKTVHRDPGLTAYQEGEVSFEEIGRAMGITKGGAWFLYRSGMQKLRHPRNRARLLELQELVRFKASLRPREVGE
jgi:hypothetical protein